MNLFINNDRFVQGVLSYSIANKTIIDEVHLENVKILKFLDIETSIYTYIYMNLFTNNNRFIQVRVNPTHLVENCRVGDLV